MSLEKVTDVGEQLIVNPVQDAALSLPRSKTRNGASVLIKVVASASHRLPDGLEAGLTQEGQHLVGISYIDHTGENTTREWIGRSGARSRSASLSRRPGRGWSAGRLGRLSRSGAWKRCLSTRANPRALMRLETRIVATETETS